MGWFSKRKEKKQADTAPVQTVNTKSEFVYFFMISCVRKDGALQKPDASLSAVKKMLCESIAGKDFPEERFILIYPQEISDAGAWGKDPTPEECALTGAELEKVADRYVIPYFNIDPSLIQKHTLAKKVTPSKTQVMCELRTDCDIREFAPEGSEPRLAIGRKMEVRPAQPVVKKTVKDQYLLVFYGYPRDIRTALDPNPTRFQGLSDTELRARMAETDAMTKVLFDTTALMRNQVDANVEMGIPKEAVRGVPETDEFYAKIPWQMMQATGLNQDMRYQIAAGPLMEHATAYLKTKGYTDQEITTANVLFPHDKAKELNPKIFPDGSIGVFSYVMIVTLWQNDFVKKEMEEERRGKEEKRASDLASGKRVYFTGKIYGGETSDMVLKMLPSRMNLARILSCDIGSITSLDDSEWNAPSYGKLSRDEIENASSPAALRLHEMIKDAFVQYLLKKGYTKEEIDQNYRLANIDGRGGSGGVLFVTVEMGMK